MCVADLDVGRQEFEDLVGLEMADEQVDVDVDGAPSSLRTPGQGQRAAEGMGDVARFEHVVESDDAFDRSCFLRVGHGWLRSGLGGSVVGDWPDGRPNTGTGASVRWRAGNSAARVRTASSSAPRSSDSP